MHPPFVWAAIAAGSLIGESAQILQADLVVAGNSHITAVHVGGVGDLGIEPGTATGTAFVFRGYVDVTALIVVECDHMHAHPELAS